MEQSCYVYDSLNSAEIEVIRILSELPHIISESTRRRFTWGGKRMRSALTKEQFTVASLPAVVKVKLSPPSPPPPELTESKTEKILTSSPATPLSFSPSESDEKPPKRRASVNTLQRNKEQMLEMIKDFTLRNESLKKDIENKKLFLDHHRAENLQLKTKREELCLSLAKAKGPSLVSMEAENGQGENSQGHHHHQQTISTRVYQKPLIMERTVCKSEINFSSGYSYNNGMISWLQSNTGGLSNKHDFIDLNASAEDVFGFGSPRSVDQISTAKARAAAAQARFNRMQKCRSKNQTNSKARCPIK